MTPERKVELEAKIEDLFRCESFGYAVSTADVLELLEEVERETWLKASRTYTEWLKQAQMSGQSFEDVCRQHAEAAR